MRSSILVLAGAALLLCTGAANALSLKTVCENAKLRAAGEYAKCLARSASQINAKGGDLSDGATGTVAACGRRFDRAFEAAEAIGGCKTAGGPSSLRGPLRGGLADIFKVVTSGQGCPTTPVADGSTYVCVLKSGVAVDLAAILQQIQSLGVSDVGTETPVWIEAWGGHGGQGNTSNGGVGGMGGYAQTITSVYDFATKYNTTTLYYYLGKPGAGSVPGAGGDGGTATVVTANDLTQQNSASLSNTLLIAGGGGGGGAGRGTSSACGNGSSNLYLLGGGGGVGGEAIASYQVTMSGPGARGGERRTTNVSGYGGHDGTGGSGYTPGQPGDDGIAALGGVGGNDSDPSIGFLNQPDVAGITGTGGAGGPQGDSAGGGGGGGGYGAGGGGEEGTGGTDCVSGGGGGGASWATAGIESCGTRSRPGGSPNGDGGAVQIVFQVGACD